MKTDSKKFAGWSDFIATVERPPCRALESSCREDGSNGQDRSWYWTGNYDEALKLAKTGWAEGFKAISVKSDVIAKSCAGLEMAARLTEAGDEVDVGLFLSGEPECMIEFPMEPRRKPVVKFVVSVAICAAVEPELIYNRGAAIMAAIDSLECSGVRVEVILDHTVESGGTAYNHTVPLKGADEALDRDKLAFAICHASTLRRLFFRMHEIDSKERWEAMGGFSYGMPTDPRADAEAIVIPAVKYHGLEPFRTMESATQFTSELITRAMEIQS